ncbi:CD177 antigen [Molossus molossus]|uniref:CD177 antigen n=1 Tax=Molossus molossus TaxID=27622 RepID=UPI0017466626|nr:CD177 antigen [Molossus molossus]
MSPALLPALLGLTLLLPRVQALTCQSIAVDTVIKISELPFRWTAEKEKPCADGWGCQDVLMLTENGPEVYIVVIKGCTKEKDHEARVIKHRQGPGLSVTSYTRVCRQKDLCNNLSSTFPVWTLPPTAVPGFTRCPFCLSTKGCESVTNVTCPIGHTHCYNGVLQLRGESIHTNLAVRGCMSQAACNLLNETRKIGSLSVSENCDPNAFLTCRRGTMIKMQPNLSQNQVQWNALSTVVCDLKEVCQETLLLVDVGPRSLILGSKGCSKTKTQSSKTVSIHSGPPGVIISSYAHFCSSNMCNNASSSRVLVDSLPRSAPPPPGYLHCPVCVQIGGFCTSSINFTCPNGTTHCYDGLISLNGGEC